MTAYELRISDWSSDVFSSDLIVVHFEAVVVLEVRDRLRLLLKDDEPVRVFERRDRARRLVIVVQRLGRRDERAPIFAAGSGIDFDKIRHRAAAEHLPR